MRNTVQTVDRALRILEAFDGEEDSLSVSELAARLGVHRSTASRLVATMAARGFLERAPRREAFRLGPRLGRLGLLAAGDRTLSDVARSLMEELAERTGETVTLAVADCDEPLTIAQVDARYVVGVKNWVGRRTPSHCTSDGKVLLAFGEVQIPRGPLAGRTARTITRKSELAGELERIRRKGWASAVGEYEENLHGVAAPVLDGSRACRAALTISGPSYRVPPRALRGLAQSCLQTAGEIGARIVMTGDSA